MFSLVIGILPTPTITPQASAQDSTLKDSEKTYNDIKWLDAANKACLGENVIDSEGDINKVEDIFHSKKYGGNARPTISGYDARLAIVGYPLDGEGVASCGKAIDQALRIVGRSSGSKNAMAKELLGTDNFSGTITRETLKKNIADLKRQIESKRSELKSKIDDQHYTYYRQRDMFAPKSLVDLCFDVKKGVPEKTGEESFTTKL